MASDSPRATTPRTTGRRGAPWGVIGEKIAFETWAMSPSGFRTATDQFEGPRIITPSKTAWPPMGLDAARPNDRVKAAARAKPARPEGGTASGASGTA